MIINTRGWIVNDQIFTCWSGSTLLPGAQIQQKSYTNAEYSIMKTSGNGGGQETTCRVTKLYRDTSTIHFLQHYHL